MAAYIIVEVPHREQAAPMRVSSHLRRLQLPHPTATTTTTTSCSRRRRRRRPCRPPSYCIAEISTRLGSCGCGQCLPLWIDLPGHRLTPPDSFVQPALPLRHRHLRVPAPRTRAPHITRARTRQRLRIEQGGIVEDVRDLRNTPFLSNLHYMQTIILPRQARDKHRATKVEGKRV